jgi:DNA adenine methylase
MNNFHSADQRKEPISFQNKEGLMVAYKRPLTGKSLLRYPGGKTRAIGTIIPYFPSDVSAVCSPFFGGGSVELYLAAKGIRIFGYDIFNPLVEFWQCATSSPEELSAQVGLYYPLTKKRFYELQEKQTGFQSKIERAAVYYVLNRSSFSGSTLSGGMSPGHPRFTGTSIQRLRDFYNPHVSVEESDFAVSIAHHPEMFTYLDPPYLTGRALYGKKGNTHRHFDHDALREVLMKRGNWILSYNDCPEIRRLYAGFRITIPEWKYGMSSNKISREILISSEDITPGANASA